MTVAGRDVARVLAGWPRCEHASGCSALRSEFCQEVLDELGDLIERADRGDRDMPGLHAWLWWCDEHAGAHGYTKALALVTSIPIRHALVIPGSGFCLDNSEPADVREGWERIAGPRGQAALRWLTRHRNCNDGSEPDWCSGCASPICTKAVDHATLKVARRFARRCLR